MVARFSEMTRHGGAGQGGKRPAALAAEGNNEPAKVTDSTRFDPGLTFFVSQLLNFSSAGSEH